MQVAISDLSSARVDVMDYVVSGCSALLTEGYDVNRQEAVQELQNGLTQVMGETGMGKLLCCFYSFCALASAV